MRRIKLKNVNKYTLVDDDMYEVLGKFTWRADRTRGGIGYVIRNIVVPKTYPSGKRKLLNSYMHQVVLGNPEGIVDHVNRNTLDNRRKNLRVVTHSENQMNRPAPKNNTSGYKGVHYHKRDKTFRVTICKKRLGSFKTARSAARAYNKAAKDMFGKFALLNVL